MLSGTRWSRNRLFVYFFFWGGGGYGVGQNGYCCYDVVSNKLYVSLHVTFVEHINLHSIPATSHDATKSYRPHINPFYVYI